MSHKKLFVVLQNLDKSVRVHEIADLTKPLPDVYVFARKDKSQIFLFKTYSPYAYMKRNYALLDAGFPISISDVTDIAYYNEAESIEVVTESNIPFWEGKLI